MPPLPRALACLLASALALPVAFADGPASAWTDVTSNVGGDKWGAYGVHTLKAVPDSDVVIAGVSEVGLWATSDNGATWNYICRNSGSSSGPGVPTSRDDSCVWRNPGPASAQAMITVFAQADDDSPIGAASHARVVIAAQPGGVPYPWQQTDIGAVARAGSSIPARMAMMAITTSSSMRVNAEAGRRGRRTEQSIMAASLVGLRAFYASPESGWQSQILARAGAGEVWLCR